MQVFDFLSAERIEQLLKRSSPGPCISLYMPTFRAGPEVQQNAVRFKNLMDQAREKLAASGVRGSDITKLLEPLAVQQRDHLFWNHQADGLAVFHDSEHSEMHRLPLAVPELVVVGDHFHLKPLFSLLACDGRFFILALSQKEARLFECSRHTWAQVEVPDMPEGRAQIMQYIDQDRSDQLQFHTETAGPGDAGPGEGRPAMFHGQGGVKGEAKTRILEYFRQVDAALHPVVRDLRAPMVFAGVDYLFPIYREANRFANLFDTPIHGNPDHKDGAELHREGWALIEPMFQAKRHEAANRLHELVGGPHASMSVESVIPAACDGRVAVLFVASDKSCPGGYDPVTRAVTLKESEDSAAEDLLDKAAAHTFLHRGQVYAVPSTEMPIGNGVAAVYRY